MKLSRYVWFIQERLEQMGILSWKLKFSPYDFIFVFLFLTDGK